MADKEVGTSPLDLTTKVSNQYTRTLNSNGRPSLEHHEKTQRDSSKSEKEHDDAGSTSQSSLGSMSIIPVDDIDVEQAPRLEPTRTKTQSSSVLSKDVTVIPRNKRRGVLGRYGLIPEVARPVQDYTRKTKWTLTLIVAVAAAAAPMGSAIFFPVLPELALEFNTTPAVTNLSVALYMLSMAIFPLWWSSFSESLGRRTIYFASFCLFTIGSILSAVSTSMGMLIAMRVIGGGAAASVQAVGAGTIADLWEPYERGKAMGIFYLGPLLGPLFAPIIGGALGERFNWRATQWFLTIYGGIMVILILLLIPETLIIKDAKPKPTPRPTTSADSSIGEEKDNGEKEARATLTRVITKQSVVQGTRKFGKMMHRFWVEPLKPLLFLRFPAVIIIVYYAAVTFGSLYVLNVSLQATFTIPPYNFSTLIVGLMYIPAGLGYVVACSIGGRWSDYIMIREARQAGRFKEGTDGSRREDLLIRPEDRMMENAYIAAFVYPSGLILYGWSANEGWHWIVPCIANFFFGLGSMIIFSVATTMLTEFMPKKSSSGVAVNNLVRNCFACVGGVVAQPIIEAIGNGWLFTILSIWCFLSVSVVWSMRHFGPRWRAEMMKTLEKEA